jgi:integrase/recombinase XerD
MPAVFRSSLASRLQAFLEMRRLAGQQGLATLKTLRYLDHFLVGELKPGDTITEEVAQRWFPSMELLSAGTRLKRIAMLRQVCLYLRHFDPRTCVVHRSFFPRCNRPMPYIYSRREVCRLMAAAKRIGPPGSLRPAVVYTVIGLLFSTGLRISEALKLSVEDIDLKRRLLHIRLTKFNKSRYVPLSPSTTRHLAAYLAKLRRAGFATSPDSPVFVSLRRTRYSHTGFTTAFLAISRKLGIRPPQGQRGARIHDARHSFSVHRLSAWYRSGANLFVKLPALSTYLGHSTVSSTQVYLHSTAELLERTGERFHAHFAIPPAKRRLHAPD